MKKIKKVLMSFLIIGAIILSQSVSAFALETTNDIEERGAGDMTISIYAAINTTGSSSGVSGLGNSHSWIVIKNTGAAKTIGNYRIAHNSSVSIGTWGNTAPKGIWYNLERKKISQFQNNSNTVYDKMIISEAKLSAINNVIKSGNKWSLTNNCTHFAIRLWNAAGGNYSSCTTPAALRTKIMNSGGYSTGRLDGDFQACSTEARAY